MNRGQKGGIFQPQTLDIDQSIIDNNLRIVEGDDEEQIVKSLTGMFQTSY